MRRKLNFIGALSWTDCKELNAMGADYGHDKSVLPKTGGLNALLDNTNGDSSHISSNATNIFDPIYVVRPNQNSTHQLLEILAEFHRNDKTVSVYYDDLNEHATAGRAQRTDYEKSMKILQDQGITVYRSVREVEETLNPIT